MKIKLGTSFSGIGAIEFALKRLRIDYDISFAIDNGDIEIDYNQEKELKFCNLSFYNNSWNKGSSKIKAAKEEFPKKI